MKDILSIMWKEWRELAGRPGLRGKVGILVNLVVFGIVLPHQMGAAWTHAPLGALMWAWVPMWLVVMIVADAFAGERERHTLETLLATRLSDRAILGGKIAAAAAYGLATAAIVVMLAVLVVNVSHGGFQVPVGVVTLAALCAGTVFAAIAVASMGVLVSLRAPTVRQAEQTLGAVIVSGAVGLIVLVKQLPRNTLAWMADPSHTGTLGFALLGLLAVLAAFFTLIAAQRFKRGRLLIAVN